MALQKTELRVGIFVLVALMITVGLAFLVGERNDIFSSKRDYYAIFDHVEGLRAGSRVRIAGVHVGSVSDVKLLEKSGRIKTTLSGNRNATAMIRQGSVVSITSKGMLGDKLIDISVGEGKVLPTGSTLPAETPSSIGMYLQKVGKVLDETHAITRNVRKVTVPLSSPQFAEDIRATVHQVADISKQMAEGRGTINRLLSDPTMANTVHGTLRNLQQSARELSGTLRSIRRVVDTAHNEKGALHALLYDPSGEQLVRNLADATGEVALLMRDVRTKPGTVHDLIYENKADNLIANLTAVSEDLKFIAHQVRKGEGTLGRMLTDPSVYEDLKRLVGNLNRNQVLRSLVRYSIKQDQSPEQAPEPVSVAE